MITDTKIEFDDAVAKAAVNIGRPDSLLAGDQDGDGKSDMIVYQYASGAWRILTSSSNFANQVTLAFGTPGAVPVPGDYDGDGKMDPALFERATHRWFVLTSGSGYTTTMTRTFATGYPGSFVPVQGDYDGDGRTDMAEYGGTTGDHWIILTSSSGFTSTLTVDFGGVDDLPAPADYDGDGRTDIATYGRLSNRWRVQWWPGTGNFAIDRDAHNWGDSCSALGEGRPIAADYDADGKADFGVYCRPDPNPNFTTTSSTYWRSDSAFAAFNIGGADWSYPGAFPVAGDYDGDGRSELVSYGQLSRAADEGNWAIVQSPLVPNGFGFGTRFGGPGYVALPAYPADVIQELPSDRTRAGDHDGDWMTDLTVYNAGAGFWYTLTSASGYAGAMNDPWGGAGRIPMPGDFDGDGRSDLALYDPVTGVWSVAMSGSNYATSIVQGWGGTGYTPVPGDYDGDGRTDLAVYHTASGTWNILESGHDFTTARAVTLGGSGYMATPADFDGDGLADPAVYQPSTGVWLVRTSRSGYATVISQAWGGPSRQPVPLDYDGDGRAEFATYNVVTGYWQIKVFSNERKIGWGGAGYAAMAGDYDGDGRADLALYQMSTDRWLILRSTADFQTVIDRHWGGPGYTALPMYP